MARKVLKIDRFFEPEDSDGSKGSEGSKGVGRRLRRQFIKTFIIALAGEGKPYNRAYGAGKCTPIPLRGVLLKGSMSLDSQSSTTPYESSSFATPEGEVCSMPNF